MQATIGVVGNGFVGNAIAKGFQSHFKRSGFHDKFEVRVYDVDKDKSTHSYMDALMSDYIFICLPTPMIGIEGGKCNLSILEDFFDDIPSTIDGTFIIKSTVPIGTTDKFIKRYPHLKIIHNPEFLTAANAEYDFINSDRHVIGGDKRIAYAVLEIFRTRDNIENYNEKALYIMIREMTGTKTQYITKVVNEIKKEYVRLYDLYEKNKIVL